jgi:hypothetical protein
MMPFNSCMSQPSWRFPMIAVASYNWVAIPESDQKKNGKSKIGAIFKGTII